MIRASYPTTAILAKKARTTRTCRSTPIRCGSSTRSAAGSTTCTAILDTRSRSASAGRRRGRSAWSTRPSATHLYTAIDGRGAFLNGAADRRSTSSPTASRRFSARSIGIDWPGDMDARKEMLTIVGTLVPMVLTVRVIGSPALALCYVAAGRLHGYSALDLRAVGRCAGARHPAERGRHRSPTGGQLVVPLARRRLRGLQLGHPRPPAAVTQAPCTRCAAWPYNVQPPSRRASVLSKTASRRGPPSTIPRIGPG